MRRAHTCSAGSGGPGSRRSGYFSEIKSDFEYPFLTNLTPIFDKEFPRFDYDPFGLLIQKDPKLVQLPTLDVWYL